MNTEPETQDSTPLTKRRLRPSHPFVAASSYWLLLTALACTVGTISVTAANMLPGVIPFEDTRTLVVTASGEIVLFLAAAFYVERVDGSPLAEIWPRLVHRSRSLLEILGLRRSSHQTLAALGLGLAGGALAFGLDYLVQVTAMFPPSTQPDAREAAIANVSPIIGNAFFVIHSPLWEEISWRGLLLLGIAAVTRELNSRHTQLAATLMLLIVTSAAFGYSHMNWSTENAVTAGLSGLIFGALAIKQQSIWPAVIAHAAANFALIVFTW